MSANEWLLYRDVSPLQHKSNYINPWYLNQGTLWEESVSQLHRYPHVILSTGTHVRAVWHMQLLYMLFFDEGCSHASHVSLDALTYIWWNDYPSMPWWTFTRLLVNIYLICAWYKVLFGACIMSIGWCFCVHMQPPVHPLSKSCTSADHHGNHGFLLFLVIQVNTEWIIIKLKK